ncbi:MAG: hypothetical protein QM757_26230 [Paludibaculum sp.]
MARSGAAVRNMSGLQLVRTPTLVYLLWQERTEQGSNGFYLPIDPAHASVGRPVNLFSDEHSEHALSGGSVEDDDIAVVFNRTLVSRESRTITLDDGQSALVSDLPTPIRTDLGIVRLTPLTDATVRWDQTASELREAGTLRLLVRNLGDFPLERVSVNLSAENADGRIQVLNTLTLDGLLAAGAEQPLTLTAPDLGSAVRLLATVVVGGDRADQNGDNDSDTLELMQPDLSLSVLSVTTDALGGAHALLEVRNQGIGSVEGSEIHLSLPPAGETNDTVAASVAFPTLPGQRAAVVSLDLPPGSIVKPLVLGTAFFASPADWGTQTPRTTQLC